MTKKGSIADRLGVLLGAFSPWESIALTYRQFAAEIGPPVTEAAVKKWPQRKKFPADIARLIVSRARVRGVSGVTLEWLLWGDGPGPQKAPKAAPITEPELLAPPIEDVGAPQLDAHGRLAARIAAALQADLSHNEFGQWSSVEVRRTVTWALKDLARRLRVLGFDMGKTFELTDEWAGTIGLPVRQPPRASDEESRTP
jgi:hypothetical protein